MIDLCLCPGVTRLGIDVHLIGSDDIDILDADECEYLFQVTANEVYRASPGCANNGDFLARATSLDMAIVGGPVAFLQGYIERGELVPILTGFPRPQTGMYALYPPGRLVSKRVKLLSDFLHQYFSRRDL